MGLWYWTWDCIYHLGNDWGPGPGPPPHFRVREMWTLAQETEKEWPMNKWKPRQWVLEDRWGQWFEEERVVACLKHCWQIQAQRGGGAGFWRVDLPTQISLVDLWAWEPYWGDFKRDSGRGIRGSWYRQLFLERGNIEPRKVLFGFGFKMEETNGVLRPVCNSWYALPKLMGMSLYRED